MARATTAAVAVEQPRRDPRGGREAARRRPAAAGDRRDQPARCPSCPTAPRWRPMFFDVVVTDPAGTHAVFAPPNNKVSAADYAIGLHAVQPGGRRRHAADRHRLAGRRDRAGADRARPPWRRVPAHPRVAVPRRPGGPRAWAASTRACTAARRCSSTASCKLIEAGIIRREVFGDAVLQQLLNDGRWSTRCVTPALLRALLDAGRIRAPLRRRGPGLPEALRHPARRTCALDGDAAGAGRRAQCATTCATTAAFDAHLPHAAGHAAARTASS